jgi:electron transfer flavoprotein alpha subunit
MGTSHSSVWVIAEQIDCRILTVSLQLIGHARKLADELETEVETVLLGDRMDQHVHQLFAAGYGSTRPSIVCRRCRSGVSG